MPYSLVVLYLASLL